VIPAPPPRRSALKLVEVVGVTVRRRGRAVLDGVSFTVEEGEILGLVGPPGSGKTACLDCLSGVVAPVDGRLIFDGREVTGAPRRHLARAGIARALFRAAAIPRRTVLDNVMIAAASPSCGPAARLLGPFRSRARGQALDVLARVELAGVAARPAGLLPPAMRKRLEIARALATRPRLLLLDDPLAGLGPDDAAGVGGLVAGLRADGLTLVLAARRIPEPGLVDRTVALRHGRVVASGARVRRAAG
jgi:ABC-type branched-subunit amino acid transport system ATPase component